MSKVFVATYVDFGETCNGKTGVLGVYRFEAEAIANVKSDMDSWRFVTARDAGIPEESLTLDYGKMSVVSKDGNFGCEWNVEEADLD